MKRRVFIAVVISHFACNSLQAADADTLRVYYGTKNQSGSKGIYTGTLNLKTGELSEPQLAAEAENAGFIAISKSGRFLYAVASGKAARILVMCRLVRRTTTSSTPTTRVAVAG